VGHLVVLACVLMATSKKRSSTFLEEKIAPREKNLAFPMNLPTPVKNSAEYEHNLSSFWIHWNRITMSLQQ